MMCFVVSLQDEHRTVNLVVNNTCTVYVWWAQRVMHFLQVNTIVTRLPTSMWANTDTSEFGQQCIAMHTLPPVHHFGHERTQSRSQVCFSCISRAFEAFERIKYCLSIWEQMHFTKQSNGFTTLKKCTATLSEILGLGLGLGLVSLPGDCIEWQQCNGVTSLTLKYASPAGKCALER